MVKYVNASKQSDNYWSVRGIVFQVIPFDNQVVNDLGFAEFDEFKPEHLDICKLRSKENTYIVYSSGNLDFNPIHHSRLSDLVTKEFRKFLESRQICNWDKFTDFECFLTDGMIDGGYWLDDILSNFGTNIYNEIKDALIYYFGTNRFVDGR